jgi:hypothetical protein
MLRSKLITSVLCLSALGASAASAQSGGDLSIRVRDDQAPAGATVQIKVRTTEATPISGGRPQFAFDASTFDDVVGIGMFAPTGEVAGAAVLDGNRASITYVTTTPETGDFPLLTVTLRTRPDATAGSRTTFTLDPSSVWNLNGTMVAAKVSPGRVTIGGSVAISDIIPGEGWFPAGTIVSVHGTGFDSRTRVRVDGVAITSVRFVSPTEMRFTLSHATNMTAARVKVINPDSSTSTYYSYLRGIPAATSRRTLLSMTRPIFSGTTRSLSTFGPIPGLTGAQYAALALQNPNLTTAYAIVLLYSNDGTLLHWSVRPLRSGHRLTLELSELFDGVAPPPGASVRVISTLPIEMFGLLCDEETWTVTPRLPAEAGGE